MAPLRPVSLILTEQMLAAEPPVFNAAWQRKALAEAFVDALAA